MRVINCFVDSYLEVVVIICCCVEIEVLVFLMINIKDYSGCLIVGGLVVLLFYVEYLFFWVVMFLGLFLIVMV